MARLRGIADRAELLLGKPVVATSPVAGGDICTTTRLRLANGRSALMKTHANPPPGFFAAEAAGLRWLAAPEPDLVAPVLAVSDDALIVEWVEPTRPSAEVASKLGHALARMHARGADEFGGHLGAEAGFIGTLPLPNRTARNWPEFYATRRVLPYLKLACDRGNLSEANAATIERMLHRITDIAGPDEPPARIHGDLWSGNVVWSHERAVLIDPAAHGGHRETDLAMLALFGAPQLERILDAYQAETPLADGWEERRGLHQIHPLLVHTALFGGHYGERAARAAKEI